MRIVVDSNVLVRAFMNPGGSAAALLIEIYDRQHSLILSSAIMAEATRVLRYRHIQRMHGFHEQAVYDFAASFHQAAEFVSLNELLNVPTRDPEDLDVMRTAVAGKADVLCTVDRDFYEWPASTSLAERGISVMTDAQ